MCVLVKSLVSILFHSVINLPVFALKKISFGKALLADDHLGFQIMYFYDNGCPSIYCASCLRRKLFSQPVSRYFIVVFGVK